LISNKLHNALSRKSTSRGKAVTPKAFAPTRHDAQIACDLKTPVSLHCQLAKAMPDHIFLQK
jgi:hypothetical protein